jgi:hypothetical protein
MFMASLWFRFFSIGIPLAGSVLTGTYHLVKLGQECETVGFFALHPEECVFVTLGAPKGPD